MPTGVNLGTNTIQGSAEVKLSRVLGGRIWGSPRPTCTPPPCTMTRRTCCSSYILRKAARSCTGRACRQNLSRLSEPTSKFVQVLLGMPRGVRLSKAPGWGWCSQPFKLRVILPAPVVRTNMANMDTRTGKEVGDVKPQTGSREATPGTGCTPCHM
jgi:hypothetical protein